VAEVNEISENSLNNRLNQGNGADELAMLAKTFNSMLERIERAFIIQKGFVSYASHELRTPLTAILGQIEVALNVNRSTDEYKLILISINEEILKLKKLTNGILRLFQLQSSGIKIKLTPTRIDEILFAAVSQVKNERQADIEVEFGSEPTDVNELLINGNEDLLLLTLVNVIENGIKFSDNKPVKVILSSYSEKLTLEIQDQGIGVANAELTKIFQPFYRSQDSSSIHGYGIGLALVKQILELHKADYALKSTQSHTTFTISFPR
jgi:signal transduction histidine kinase